jgi:hypothetical protein
LLRILEDRRFASKTSKGRFRFPIPQISVEKERLGRIDAARRCQTTAWLGLGRSILTS